MELNDDHGVLIMIYSILILLSCIGNISVLVILFRLYREGRLNGINLFLLHLSMADMFITFLLMPLEAFNWTMRWAAGDIVCRVMAYFRTFSLSLSGFLRISMTVDRCLAYFKPTGTNGAECRARLMLPLAWVSSAICSVPEALVFHVEPDPRDTRIERCVTFESFPTPELQLLYNTCGFILLYAFPLIMTIGGHLLILWKISMVNNQNNADNLDRPSSRIHSEAEIKTLKLTLIIVLTYFIFWTPHYVTVFWNLVKPESADKLISPRIKRGLFHFACANTCFNPLLYIYKHLGRREEVRFLHPNSYRPRHHTQDPPCQVRWRQSEDSVGTTVVVTDEGVHVNNPTSPSGSIELNEMSVASGATELSSKQHGPRVSIIFDGNTGLTPVSFCNESEEEE